MFLVKHLNIKMYTQKKINLIKLKKYQNNRLILKFNE